MNAAFLLRLAWREGRGARGRLTLLVLGIAVGVSAVVAVGALGAGLRQGLFLEARRLLAADVALSTRDPWPAELDGILAAEPDLRSARVVELPTVVAAKDAGSDGAAPSSRLVELKVVEPAYPLRGDLKIDPPVALETLLADGGAVISPDLGQMLGLRLGDPIAVGTVDATVRGFVLSEPDRTNFALSLGPRVFVGHDTFAQSGLEQFGSRIESKLLLALPDGATADEARALGLRLRAALADLGRVRVNTWADAQPSVRRGIERVESFLALAALLALVLGALAAALAARSWLESRIDSIALSKCLGLERRHVLISAVGQVLILALLGGLLGTVLGVLAVRVAVASFRDLLPAGLSIPLIEPRPVLMGLALGLGSALVAALGPLLAATRVPPLAALRRESAPLVMPRGLVRGSAMVALAALFVAAWVQSSSVELAALFTGGLVLSALVLALAARAVLSLARRAPPRALPAPLRWGLASLARPENPARGALLALGIGVFAVLSLVLVERRLLNELANALPVDAPNAFMLDVQRDQWPALEQLLLGAGAVRPQSAPMVVGRLRAIDGRDVRTILAERRDARREGREGGGGRWVLTREQRLTFGPNLQADNVLLRGALWADPERAEVSVEEEYAEDLEVDLGSVIVVDVQGVPIELVVTSIRSVRWESLAINFFMHVEPGVLDNAPQVRVATARLPKGQAGAIQNELRAAFPNVTLIDVDELREKLAVLFARLASGVEALGLLCVAAGVLVLAAAMAAAGRERRREAGLLRALGAGRWSALASLASEYALLGAVAGLVGGGGAAVLAYALVTRILELEGGPALLAPLAAAGLLGALAAAAGSIAAALALRRPPAEVLQQG